MTCRRCIFWKRRSDSHGVCWHDRHDAPTVAPDETCRLWSPKVLPRPREVEFPDDRRPVRVD